MLPTRFVVAPSGFKECLDAEDVAQAIAAGVRRVVPGAVVDLAPLVDGGEGSARALAASTGGELVPVTVRGPLGDPVPAHFALLGGPGPRTALVEMAAAAGLRLVPPDARDPGATSTYGVGELIRAALDARLAGADLVITAEGAIDFQTPHGKVPAEVARRAKRLGKPVIALVGTIGHGARRNHDVGIDAYASILAAPVVANAGPLLADATERVLRLILVGAALNPAVREA